MRALAYVCVSVCGYAAVLMAGIVGFVLGLAAAFLSFVEYRSGIAW